jgi:hypothetical protein
MNKQKQQTKHAHRERMVSIGIRAVGHVLQQSDSVYEILSDYIGLIRNHETAKISELVRKQNFHNCYPHNRDRILTRAVEALLWISVSGKYVSGEMLEFVLVPSFNSFVYISDAQQQQEIAWQNKELRPLIEKSFKQLKDEQQKLKA